MLLLWIFDKISKKAKKWIQFYANKVIFKLTGKHFKLPGFPDQADHNLIILWHHRNHTNFLTMILPWSAWNHIWSRVWSAWNHIWSRVWSAWNNIWSRIWSAWNHKFLFQTCVDVTCNPNKNFQILRTASFIGRGQWSHIPPFVSANDTLQVRTPLSSKRS